MNQNRLDLYTCQVPRDHIPLRSHPLFCESIQTEHRLTKPRTPRTNGMVERFNGRISELLDATRFASASELPGAIKHYERLYNHCIPQKALCYKTPVVELKFTPLSPPPPAPHPPTTPRH